MDKKDHIENNLLEYSKQNSFIVPEGYFDNFPDRLTKRIQDEQKSSTRRKSINFRSLLHSKFAMAASILLFISISYFTINKITDRNIQSESQYFAELIDLEISDYDLSLIAEYYPDEEIIEEDLNTETDNNIIDFLVNEDIDIELIIEEF